MKRRSLPVAFPTYKHFVNKLDLLEFDYVKYLNVFVDAFVDPLLNLAEIHVDLDEAQFAASLDQLIRLHDQFLEWQAIKKENKQVNFYETLQ